MSLPYLLVCMGSDEKSGLILLSVSLCKISFPFSLCLQSGPLPFLLQLFEHEVPGRAGGEGGGGGGAVLILLDHV